MSYTYPIDAQAMFIDRAQQFIGFGIPEADVRAVQANVTEMWRDAPGGWVYEWSTVAARYATDGHHYLASLLYGCAKSPCLADAARAEALAMQVTEYVAAAPTFPVHFERRLLTLPYRGSTVAVPVHLYTTAATYADAPVLLASGGVDTWKINIHPMSLALTQQAGVTVLAFDQPGTGEMLAPMTANADEVILGFVHEAKALGNGKVAHLGVSFGGNYAAMTGLMQEVDAAIVLGGPIDGAFQKEHLERLPYGMRDIVGNAIGFGQQPTFDALVAAAAPLSRHGLLRRLANAPMLVINGVNDYFVPQSDTLVFQGRPMTEVHLIPDSGHVAMSKLPQVVPMMVQWLQTQLNHQ